MSAATEGSKIYLTGASTLLTSKTASIVEKVTGGDPRQHRYGCFLSDLTGFTGTRARHQPRRIMVHQKRLCKP